MITKESVKNSIFELFLFLLKEDFCILHSQYKNLYDNEKRIIDFIRRKQIKFK